ncbi:MAG: alpha/beta hydrolase [Chromatiales bacterium]|jgi:pimeloyl-ACP methyl ester carboxylesterase|nr:alpha/beta hydrolase [Chromatiales bacterium]
MKDHNSVYINVRGLNYHCRTWGNADAPPLFALHGFQDVSASWQFTVDALERDWFVIAPDWRGYGLSEFGAQDSFWVQDLVADLDVIIDHFEPNQAARVVAHSMGGNIAAIYASAIPGRVEKFINVEGIGGPPSSIDELPRRYGKWLGQLAEGGTRQRPYMDFGDFAMRMCAENPRLTPERADFLVQHWGIETEDGSVVRRAHPAHAQVKPSIWRLDEAMACWRQMSTPMLWVEGVESRFINMMRGQEGGYEERLAAFSSLVDIVRVEEAGHNIHHDQPAALAKAIDGFM